MGRRRAARALAHVAWIVQRIPQARMGFEPRSVRKINDAGRDVIDGGVSVVAGNRRRTAERRREAEQWTPGEAAPFPLPLLSDDRWAGRAGGRDGSNRRGGHAAGLNGGNHRRGRAPPSEQFLEDVAIVRWRGGTSDRQVGSGRMALRRLRLGGRSELRRPRRRQGEAFGLPDLRQISRRRRRKAADWRNRRSWGRCKRFETGQRERRRGNGRRGFEARHLLRRRRRSGRPLQLGKQIGVDDNVAEGLRDGRRRRRHSRRRGPPGEDRLGSG